MIKHLGKLMGQTVFAGGLHTGINEYREIRLMTLTATKAHHQFMPALVAVSKSLATYGHQPIQIIYTDNVRGDKAELERNLPQLKADLVPVPDISALETLSIPRDFNINILSSTFQVNTRLGSIMNGPDGGDDIYAAVDMEWPVDRENGIRGKIAVISLAIKGDIFILPVSDSF